METLEIDPTVVVATPVVVEVVVIAVAEIEVRVKKSTIRCLQHQKEATVQEKEREESKEEGGGLSRSFAEKLVRSKTAVSARV